MSSETAEPAKASVAARAGKKRAAKKRRVKSLPRRRAKRVAAKPARKAAKQRMTDADRAKILSVAASEGLTGAAVAKRFGISMVTYYLWRKKAGLKGKPGRRPGQAVRSSGAIESTDVRSAVQAKVREVLPEIVQAEVQRVLGEMLGGLGRK